MLEEYLERSMEKIMQLVADEHPRVRSAAIHAIYRFLRCCSPHFQNQCHQQVILALSNAMDDFSNPRVLVIHATISMGQFSLCSRSIMKPHLERIITKLRIFIQEGQTISCRETALYSLAFLAISAKDDFNPFYAMVMPHLKSILDTVEVNSNCMLVAKTLHCISAVAMSVGKSVFSTDADKIVEVLSLVQRYNSSLGAKHRVTFLLLRTWCQLCTSLGEDFQPYLDASMPQLIGLVAQKDYFIGDDWNGNDGERSIALKEMFWACETLSYIATQIKGGLFLWIDEVLENVLPLVSFEFDEQVRIAAISVMPCLLQSVAIGMEQKLFVLANTIIPALVKALEASTIKIQVQTLVALTKSIQIVETWTPDGATIVVSILNVLSACFYRKSELLKEDEKNLCTEVRNCLRVLIKRFWDQNFILEICYIKNMWAENIIAKERRMALDIFTDIAMESGEHMLKDYAKYIPLMLEACKSDTNPHIQQMAACAIGIYAEFGRETFKHHLQDGLSSLEAIIKSAAIDDLERNMARDAAVCAYGKLCFFFCEEINSFPYRTNMTKYIELWLSHLPLKCNIDEAKAAHTLLCSMIDKPETKVTGPEDSYIGKIVAIMAEVLWAGKSIATQETQSKMIQQLKVLKQKVEEYIFEPICESLPPHLHNILNVYLSS